MIVHYGSSVKYGSVKMCACLKLGRILQIRMSVEVRKWHEISGTQR